MPSRALRTLVVSLLVMAPVVAEAGPPLLCFPMATGGAPSLPWSPGEGWKRPRQDYDRSRLAVDTLALLGPQVRVLERMETLRRAVIYASSDGGAADALFAALRSRARDPYAAQADALSVFDLGYAAEAYRQTRDLTGFLGTGPGEDGYALVRRALTLRKTDPELEYAAALVAVGRPFRGPSDEHLRIAVQGAPEGSPLARTIAAHSQLWNGRAEAHRTSAAP